MEVDVDIKIYLGIVLLSQNENKKRVQDRALIKTMMSLNHSALGVFVPYYMLHKSSESAYNRVAEAQILSEQEILILSSWASYM